MDIFTFSLSIFALLDSAYRKPLSPLGRAGFLSSLETENYKKYFCPKFRGI